VLTYSFLGCTLASKAEGPRGHLGAVGKMDNVEVLTIADVARALKLTEKTVYAMALAGEIPAFKLRGQWRVRRMDLAALLERKATEASAASVLERGRRGAVSAEALKEDAHMLQATTDDAGRAVSDLTFRVSQEELHRRFVQALGASSVRRHNDLSLKPLDLELTPPLPVRVRVYMYNATRPPGGRPLGEHKVQLIVPGQRRGDRASFDNSDGRIVFLVGYAAEEDVFILWDAGLYADFAWSRNVQVKAETIIQATAGKLASQERQLRPPRGRAVIETVLAAKPRNLVAAIIRRMALTRERLLRD